MSKTIQTPTDVVRCEWSGNRANAFDTDGNKRTSEITVGARQKAADGGYMLGRFEMKNGKFQWRRYDGEVSTPNTQDSSTVEVPQEHEEILQFIHNSYGLKPRNLMMSELKWKYLVRSGVRGKNIMMTGPAGCGKTMAAKSLVNSLDRPDYYFNLGATQDPRSTLIGNTHFDSKKGTYFSESHFVKAIQTPNSVILLDELSRAHPDAWNILMTVLDYGQRYLRIDESSGSDTIKVADGVTFVATANIGNEYTSTRVMDKALMDRFTIVEMDVLDTSQELELLQYMFPHVDVTSLTAVAEIANTSRVESSSESGKIDTAISTRSSVEMAGLLFDGFGLDEAAQVSVYPQFSNDGGVDSERTFIKQLVQKYINDGSDDDLFNVEDIDDESLTDYDS